MFQFTFWGFTYQIKEGDTKKKYVVLPNKEVLRNTKYPTGFGSLKRIYVSSFDHQKDIPELAKEFDNAAIAEKI